MPMINSFNNNLLTHQNSFSKLFIGSVSPLCVCVSVCVSAYLPVCVSVCVHKMLICLCASACLSVCVSAYLDNLYSTILQDIIGQQPYQVRIIMRWISL